MRVELDGLDEEDFKRILTESKNPLPRQDAALLGKVSRNQCNKIHQSQ